MSLVLRLRSPIATLLVLLVTVTLLAITTGTAQAQQTINPSGGTTAANGLRIVIQPNTAFQIYRNNARQLFISSGDGPDIAVGTAVTGTYITGATPWTNVSQSTVTGDGTPASPWQVVTTVRTASNVVVEMTIRYASPDDTLDLQVIITPPGSNTESVKYSHYFDSFLSGGDNGAAFWQPNSTINPPPTIPSVLGVTKLVGAVRQYEVFIAGTPLWDRYYSAGYSAPYGLLSNGGNLNNALDTNEAVDNGFGVQWELGAITTPQAIRYRLSFSDAATTPVCGDGMSVGFEGCDDGNTTNGDGCSSLCQAENGYSCTGSPSTCATRCGDGVRAGAEACDDGGTANGDGCSATCTTEGGWTCTGSPSTCSTACGDGVRAGTEACDDGGTANGDGCSMVCAIELGWSCNGGSPTTCATTCGDGIRAGTEACDDGNQAMDDGCSATCAVEAGWSCAGTMPDTCVPGCGDGLLRGTEACDDGNSAPNDGCSAACAVEAGWTCQGEPSTCASSCGDGVVAGVEGCDDGNLAALDGCSPSCVIEDGWSCDDADPSACASSCGDGLRVGAEACDDGNTAAGDGCDELCAVETGWECTPGMPDVCVNDQDRDGVLDPVDNCLTVVNPDQADLDRDGAGDLCDDDDNGDGFADGTGVAGGGCSTSGGGSAGLGAGLALAAMLARRRRRAAAAVAVLATATTGSVALAQVTTEPRDFSVERFTLAGDATGILSLESGVVPTPWTVDTHLWVGSANDPLTVYMTDDRTRVGALVAQRTGGELGVSVGVHPRVSVGLDLPLVFAQDRAGSIDGVTGMLSDIGGVGVGDLRLRPKLALLRQGSAPVSLALIPELGLPTGAGTNYRGDDGVTFTPTLAATRWQGKLRLGGNLSYAVRPATSINGLAVDDELRLGLGTAYRVTSKLEAGATVTTATAADAPLSANGRTSVELAAGPTIAFAPRWLGFAVGGAGLRDGYGTPDWRLLIGARMTRSGESPAGRDEDRDGIVDGDRCPRAAEDGDGWEDDDGCPEDDNDGDSVADAADRCPNEAETVNGFDDTDGCPDDGDTDGDGVAGAADRCPNEAETVNDFDDTDGCPDAGDADGDGRRDDVDTCPDAGEDLDGFMDDDGCPDADNDSDGLTDDRDRCPTQAGPAENYGCPDSDEDGDGVVYRVDVCPNEPGATKFDGCKTKRRVSLRDGSVIILEPVFFKSDKDQVDRRSFGLLDNVASLLSDHSELSIQIEGHTDDRDGEDHNKQLSQRRADSVRAYLVGRGIAEARLTAAGFGEERPVADNKRSRGRSKNRRVAFVVIGVFGFDVRGGTAPHP